MKKNYAQEIINLIQTNTKELKTYTNKDGNERKLRIVAMLGDQYSATKKTIGLYHVNFVETLDQYDWCEELFYNYLDEKINPLAKWLLSDLLEIFFIGHEVGHFMDNLGVDYYAFKIENKNLNTEEKFYNYRNIPQEKASDDFSIDFINNHYEELAALTMSIEEIEEMKQCYYDTLD